MASRAALSGVLAISLLGGCIPLDEVGERDAAVSRSTGSGDACVLDAGQIDATPHGDARARDSTVPDARRTGEAAAGDDGGADAWWSDAQPPDGFASEGGAYEGGLDAGDSALWPPATDIAVSPLTLVPPFSPDIFDYYVRCAAGTNRVDLTLTPGPGATMALVQPTTSSPADGGGLSLQLSENDAVVVGVTTGASVEQYWIRCLPHDFPKMRMVQYFDAGAPTPGYYLVGNTWPPPGEKGYAVMLDRNGVPVWYHITSTGAGPFDVDDVVPGVVSFVPSIHVTFSDHSGSFELHDLSGDTTSFLAPPSTPLDLHELRYLPSGDYLLLSNPIKHGVDLTGLGSFGSNEDVIGCQIQELTPSGGIVWEWYASDHFNPVLDSTYPQTMKVSGQDVADVFHCNSIDVTPDGDYLVSARNMDSVFLVDAASGKVVWKMGGASSTIDGAAYIAVEDDPYGSFHRQHDARLLPNGNVSMYDDQTKAGHDARGIIYTLDLAAKVARPAWEWSAQGPSAEMGSFRVADDGSAVIGFGDNREPYLAFSEVDVDGDVLLDFFFMDGNISYRAIKIPVSAFDINLLRLRAGAD